MIHRLKERRSVNDIMYYVVETHLGNGIFQDYIMLFFLMKTKYIIYS